MNKGFLFDHTRCVNCKSCSAACRLYNGWHESPRNVYTWNESLFTGTAIVNISLACNHCNTAVCIEGCPSGALSRHDPSGAVVIDENKCIGCRYCQWNCPFDAPKFSNKKKVIEKCNLCYKSGDTPFCATACPTGALSYGSLTENQIKFSWFPGKQLDPRIDFKNKIEPVTQEIFPSEKFSIKEIIKDKQNLSGEWSLILFSFLAMVSVSVYISSFMNGRGLGMLFILLLAFAAMISLFHPGKPFRSWRVLHKPVSSPLSREIISMILFGLAGVASFFFSSIFISWVAIITGLVFLLLIDNVYTRSDESLILHSGQTFLTGLLMISYLSGSVIAFGFIATVKLILSLRLLSHGGCKPPSRPSPRGEGVMGLFPRGGNQKGGLNEKGLLVGEVQTIRFLRIAFLVIATAAILTGNGYGVAVTILVISAELLDRILFYYDFRPENIVRIISQNFKYNLYGKKSG